ncbi:MAG: 50S ribosomal protein L34e [Candidatus Woesearchaeota archaeon]|jgi:large subunit ribosomal protein L34e
MVRGQYRSRTFRVIKVRTPGSRVSMQFRLRKPKKAHCGVCGAVLNGVPRERPTIMRNLSKTQKRPERMYGGVLCAKCTRAKIVSKVLSKSAQTKL